MIKEFNMKLKKSQIFKIPKNFLKTYQKGTENMEKHRILKLIDDEINIVKKVCLGLAHPSEQKQEEFTKWLQDTVIFHLNQLKCKMSGTSVKQENEHGK